MIVRDIALNKGHDIQLQEYLKKGIYGFLAFPPCTHLAGSGARWWKKKGKAALKEAMALVDACMRVVALYRPTFWMLENPVGRLKKFLGKPHFTFQPHEFGGYRRSNADAYTKRTCLWGDFEIPPKKNIKPEVKDWVLKFSPGEDRAKLRSRTPLGFATAFAKYNQ
ncbi:MAG: hypothetical protein HUJ25_15735 [Crocinitomicaceae bacterium]|nr:hypothetical protein [Crocinitomicaceae bacterium]